MRPFLLSVVHFALVLSCGSGMAQGAGTAGFATPTRISSRVLPAALNQVFIGVRPAAVQIRTCSALPQDPECGSPETYAAGTLISPDGLILTAYNVISGAARLQVRTADQTYDRVMVVGFDERHDLAVLKIERPGSTAVTIAPTGPVVGQTVFAMGFQKLSTVLAKLGSVLELNVPATRDDFPSGTMRLDAPISPGDGGGGVLNEQGALVGVTSYIKTEKSPLKVFGYAVPVTADAPILVALKQGTKREAPVLGILTNSDIVETATTADAFQRRGLGSVVGCPFNQVVIGGPAAQANLQPLTTIAKSDPAKGMLAQLRGDVIVAVASEPVRACPELLTLIRKHDVGETVQLSIVRDGQTVSMEVKLTSKSGLSALPTDLTGRRLF